MFRLLKKFFKLFKSSENSSVVTRKMVLMRASKYRDNGLCYAIHKSLYEYGIITGYLGLITYFPLFTRNNALAFGASESDDFWWPIGNWSTGRKDFLNWLIKQYRDDKTDLRTI